MSASNDTTQVLHRVEKDLWKKATLYGTVIVFVISTTVGATLWCSKVNNDFEKMKHDISMIKKHLNIHDDNEPLAKVP